MTRTFNPSTSTDDYNDYLKNLDQRALAAGKRAELAPEGSGGRRRAEAEAAELVEHYYEWCDQLAEVQNIDEQIAEVKDQLQSEQLANASTDTTVLSATSKACGVAAFVSVVFLLITGNLWLALPVVVGTGGSIASGLRAVHLDGGKGESHEEVQLKRRLNDLQRQRDKALPDEPDV